MDDRNLFNTDRLRERLLLDLSAHPERTTIWMIVETNKLHH